MIDRVSYYRTIQWGEVNRFTLGGCIIHRIREDMSYDHQNIFLILAPDGYVYAITGFNTNSCLPSERYSIYIARTRAKERITEKDLIHDPAGSCNRFSLHFRNKEGKLATKSRHIVQLREIDTSNKPFWLEEWDLAELFT